MSVTRAELYGRFTEANHNGFLKDANIQIIDRVLGESRFREGF